MNGLIFSIKRYSVHDGPGIRVTFFMKGCPMSCLWCHNPEGISPVPETVTLTNRVGDREFSKKEEVGKYYSVEDILNILKKEKVFIDQSNGGVTFSGGEPMLQSEFLLEVLKACKSNGYHTAIDTSGNSSIENFKSVIPYTDLFLFDLKHLDCSKHIELTGVSNNEILENYKHILACSKEVMVRIPVVPGYNDDYESIESFKNYIEKTKTSTLKKISLLPYHKTGSSKYKRFNMQFRMDNVEQPSSVRMNEIKKYFEETGIKVKIGG